MSDEKKGEGEEEHDDHRNVSTMGLLLIAFFWVGGGIYGNEALLGSGPPEYIIVLMAIASICYAAPMAFISAELACALPYDGGLVAWVEETCGKTVGVHNAYWLWISYLFDSAAYPALAAGYLIANHKNPGEPSPIQKALSFNCYHEDAFGPMANHTMHHHHDNPECAMKIGNAIFADVIVAGITLMKLAGTDYVVKASGFFFVASMLPTIIFTFYGSAWLPGSGVFTNNTMNCPPCPLDDCQDYWKSNDCLNAATEQHRLKSEGLPIMFSWVTWLFCGFNSLGALAGEISDPGKTYPVVMGVLIPACALLFIWPAAVSLAIDGNQTAYVDGYFMDVAQKLVKDTAGGGKWLAYGFEIGAAFCFIGNYNAQIIVCERCIAAFLEEPARAYLKAAPRNFIVRYLLTENGTGVAPVYIIFNGALAGVLVWLPYAQLIEFSMLQMCLNSMLFIYAFLYYKWTRPDMDRPFKVSGGKAGAVLMAVPVTLFTLAVGYLGIKDPTVIFGLPYAKGAGLAICIFLGVLVHVLYLATESCRGGKSKVLMCDSSSQWEDADERTALLGPSSSAGSINASPALEEGTHPLSVN